YHAGRCRQLIGIYATDLRERRPLWPPFSCLKRANKIWPKSSALLEGQSAGNDSEHRSKTASARTFPRFHGERHMYFRSILSGTLAVLILSSAAAFASGAESSTKEGGFSLRLPTIN